MSSPSLTSHTAVREHPYHDAVPSEATSHPQTSSNITTGAPIARESQAGFSADEENNNDGPKTLRGIGSATEGHGSRAVDIGRRASDVFEHRRREAAETLPSPVSSNPSAPLSPIPISSLLSRRFSADSRTATEASKPPSQPSKLPSTPLSPQHPINQERQRSRNLTIDTSAVHNLLDSVSPRNRPAQFYRALSTPATSRNGPTSRRSEKGRVGSAGAESDNLKPDKQSSRLVPDSVLSLPSPMPRSIPLPPVSIPTYLQLELSSQRPSHQLIHRSTSSDFPYESSRAKIERLKNFIYLPLHLEAVLWFGMLACLDAWLYTFTILPLRLLKSIYILIQSWTTNLAKEIRFVSTFTYSGTFRVWRRRAQATGERKPSQSETSPEQTNGEPTGPPKRIRHHRRTKSVPSNLMPDDKADILKGLLIVCTCAVLQEFDASRMYHWIRGQSAIKLYVIYNVLEVCDRLFSALGQDVLECLFSREALERKPDGHSKILRPFWLFVLALMYTIGHSTALFFQVITLNVAVNAYSNALITLLLSNQFVEIKSTVFKKFEKENLFQLTCADVVERFQLWHMLVIIAARNIAETGYMVMPSSALDPLATTLETARAMATNATVTAALPPRTMSSIVPLSFTLVPEIVASITSYVPIVGHVLGPFMIVLGSEMGVDWLKHAYINKFNNTRPAIYDRFLDVLAKDYYTNAFGDQNLTKRLGLPVLPLSCLLIRASMQTITMFLELWWPVTTASQASLASIHEQYTNSSGSYAPTTTTVIAQRFNDLLGGYPSVVLRSDATSYLTIAIISLVAFLVLLAAKLVLGMLLLTYARRRYRSMKEREREPIYHVEGGRRIGGWGCVEVDEDKRRWIYDEDPDGLRALQEREERDRAKREKDKEKGIGTDSFDKVKRYEMVAKRIW